MSAEDAEALRAEIRLTREEVGETAEALAAKTDVKRRAKEAAEDAKDRAKEAVGDVKDRAKEAAGDVKDRAKEAAVDVKERAMHAAGRTKEAVRERPIPPLLIALLGAAAIAIAIYASKRK
jgi:fatty acid-binding protein DegV